MIPQLKIALHPQAADATTQLILEKQGDSLLVNSESLSLGFLGDGDTLPAGAIDHPLLRGAEIRRVGGEVEIDGLLFPISPAQNDPAACFPAPIIVSADGPIPLPPQFPPEPDPQPEQPEEPNADQH